MRERICITGIGVCSAIGNDGESFARQLKAGITGIARHTCVATNEPIWAGLVSKVGWEGEGPATALDRAAQLAMFAASQAWHDAFGEADWPAGDRVALVLGTSHGGRSQLDQCVELPEVRNDARGAQKILVVSPHHQQTDAVAHHLGIHGPVATISNACSSSGTALAYAYELLSARKVDHVVAGGMDGFSKVTYVGFRSLGAVAQAPCGPFSSTIGITLGEGAAVLILERMETAQQRGARIYAELLGYGSSWDGYHVTEPDPTGEGILRSAHLALRMAGVEPSAISYVNVHGTGTRANDAAESIALKRIFQGCDAIPPASSTKSFTGHTLGASAAMGLIASITAMRDSVLPPTVSFPGPRNGCDLDFVPNHPRPAGVDYFSCQSAGFGGVNTVLIGGRADRVRCLPERRGSRVGITGIGVISAAGLDTISFQSSLREKRTGIAPIERFGVEDCRAKHAGLVTGFEARRIIPTLNLRRADLAIQFAAAAAASALADAHAQERGLKRDCIGLIVGTTRGAALSFENFIKSTGTGEWKHASAIHFPNLVMSSIGGCVSKALSLGGIASTLVGGSGSGLQTVSHAFELLRHNHEQDAVVVVVADEIAPSYFRMFDQLGVLAAEDAPLGPMLAPYQSRSTGTVLGEGAVAFVLERLDGHDAAPYAEISGYGWTADASGYYGTAPGGEWLEAAIRLAAKEAAIGPEHIDIVYGHGRGLPCHDFREARAVQRFMGRHSTPFGCVLGNTGLAECASGGFSIAAAILGMQAGEVYPIVTSSRLSNDMDFVSDQVRRRACEYTLVVGSTDNGNNAAIVLRKSLREG